MVLHLKTKFGMDDVSLKNLTGIDSILPDDAESTIQRLTISKSCYGLFDDDCLLKRNLEYFIEMVH